MRVLLVDGVFSKKKYSEPLGISFLASVVRSDVSLNCECILYEPCIEGDCIDESVSKALEINAEIVGLSFVGESSDVCKEFIEKYKKVKTNVLFAVGGHAPSLEPLKYLNNGADIVFVGEGEISFPSFLKAYKEHKALSEIPGIAYISNDGMQITCLPPRIQDLDSLPFMARDTLKKLSNKYPVKVSARILGSRGCYMDCSYCSIQAYTALQKGNKYRERSVKSLLEEMSFLNKKMNVTCFLFEDDNFIPMDKNRASIKVDEFCTGIKKLGIPNIKLHLQCRPDNINIELAKKLLNCGLVDLFIGVESINQSDLDFLGRKSYAYDNINVIKELNKIGFSCEVGAKRRLRIGYIMFNPESTRKTLYNSCQFLQQYNVTPKRIISILRPYPHTKIRDKLIANGYFNISDSCSDIKFKNLDIQKIYGVTNSIISKILQFREKLRLPGKLNDEFDLNLQNDILFVELEQIRKSCDTLCYEAFYKVLNADNDEFLSIQLYYDEIINSMKKDNVLNNRLKLIHDRMEIFDFDFGMYR